MTYNKNAVSISHSSISDFLKCKKSYYFKNIYKDPKTGYRLQMASPYLTLGALVHDVISWFLNLNGQVTNLQLEEKYRNFFRKYRGKKGGFENLEQEASFGKRGLQMLANFYQNYKLLEKRLPLDGLLKHFLTEDIILWGRLDFVGILPDESLHIIDFKTGTKDEEDPLQLYIYSILAQNLTSKKVSKISYWYLDRDKSPKEAVLDSLEGKISWLLEKGEEMKKAIEKKEWTCVKNPDLCRECRLYQAILDGKGELVLTDDAFKKQVYFLTQLDLD